LNKKITFTSPLKGFVSEPKPSQVYIPRSYKDLHTFNKTITKPTVKKCPPFLDALTTGYIIPFPTDIEVLLDENQVKFNINSNIPPNFFNLIGVDEHNLNQISKEMMHPNRTVNAVFKFLNPWQIKTPIGYSCLFTTPFNHVLPFNLITGVVDTDTHPLNIHFPFYWTRGFDDTFIIKEGSPMAMVFPFKRESWKMETKVCNLSIEKKNLMYFDYFKKLTGSYKSKFWSKKSYK
tara:strand:- start:1856 stop:2557 length:702 start_codon:yes stop_codon:yes gene_type:complete